MAKQTEAPDPSVYLEKAPTDLQARFGDWIMEQVGYDPSDAKTKEQAFRDGVRLATATRMVFQASPENKAANAEKKAAVIEDDEDEAPKKGKKAKEAAAPVKKGKAKSAPVEEDEDEEEEAPVKSKAKGKTTKPAKRKRAASQDDEDAPF